MEEKELDRREAAKALKALELLKRQMAERERELKALIARPESPSDLPPVPVRKLTDDERERELKVAAENLRKYGSILMPKEAAWATMKKECPGCGKVKPVPTGFGFRRYWGGVGKKDLRVSPQSQCRKCRSSREAHPTRNGLPLQIKRKL